MIKCLKPDKADFGLQTVDGELHTTISVCKILFNHPGLGFHLHPFMPYDTVHIASARQLIANYIFMWIFAKQISNICYAIRNFQMKSTGLYQ